MVLGALNLNERTVGRLESITCPKDVVSFHPLVVNPSHKKATLHARWPLGRSATHTKISTQGQTTPEILFKQNDL